MVLLAARNQGREVEHPADDILPPNGDGGRRFVLFSDGGNMHQPPPGAARAGAASVELSAQVEVEDGAVTRRAPLVDWEGGIDVVVG